MQIEKTNINFQGQFRLAKSNNIKFPHWKVETFNEWTLEYCPTLNITQLFDSENQKIGCVLGYAITPDGVLLRDSTTLSFSMASSTFEDSIETYISELAGRYAVFICTETITKMYLDPAGQMSVVYTPKAKLAGSSLNIISDASEPKSELSEFINVPSDREQCSSWSERIDGYGNQYYPFGMTLRSEVKRLMPNHFLDLRNFTVHRHWPKIDELSTRSCNNIDLTVDKISQKLKSNIFAVLDNYPVYMSLTAGRDSRMLLAAAKDRWEEIEFFTLPIPDKSATLDCRVARLIAKKFGLNHQILNWKQASAEQLEDWQMRVGYSGVGRTWQAVSTLLQLDPKKAYMQGICGELGRGDKWKGRDLSSEEISIEEILVKARMPDHPVINQAAVHWLKNLPLTHPLDILDFLGLELAMGCHVGPKQYGHINNVRIPPLCDRYIFTQMFELPAGYRFQGLLAIDLIRRYSEALSTIPVNEEIGVRALLGRARNKSSRVLVKSKLGLKRSASILKSFFR